MADLTNGVASCVVPESPLEQPHDPGKVRAERGSPECESSELSRAGHSFLAALFGTSQYHRWYLLKKKMQFASEINFVKWLMDAAEDSYHRSSLLIDSSTQCNPHAVGLMSTEDSNDVNDSPNLIAAMPRNDGGNPETVFSAFRTYKAPNSLPPPTVNQSPPDQNQSREFELRKQRLDFISQAIQAQRQAEVETEERQLAASKLSPTSGNDCTPETIEKCAEEDVMEFEEEFEDDEDPLQITPFHEDLEENDQDCCSENMNASGNYVMDLRMNCEGDSVNDVYAENIKQEIVESNFEPHKNNLENLASFNFDPNNSDTLNNFISTREVERKRKKKGVGGSSKLNIYECKLCSYRSRYHSQMMKHMCTHTGIKPYRCDICNYASIQKVHLTEHMLTHSGVKPWKCEQCSYASVRKSDLVKHCKLVHGLRCQLCAFACSDVGAMQQHQHTTHGQVCTDQPASMSQLNSPLS